MAAAIGTYTAILWDMDGVLAHVGGSYRAAIIQTGAHFGVTVTGEDISVAKAKGGANNDWVLTQRLCSEGGKEVEFQAVKDKFEELYQGVPGVPGLHTLETLIPAAGLLHELKARCPKGMAVVTGRPRRDCEKFINDFGLKGLFKACVCMEDGPPKPDPGPVRRALEALGVPAAEALMIGDTPDDIRSAVAAGAVGIGVLTPEEHARAVLGVDPSAVGMRESLAAAGAVCARSCR